MTRILCHPLFLGGTINFLVALNFAETIGPLMSLILGVCIGVLLASAVWISLVNEAVETAGEAIDAAREIAHRYIGR